MIKKGRGTTVGMFALRQLVEKRLEMQGVMVVGFVDLEKAYDTVPRHMVMATVRWMGVQKQKPGWWNKLMTEQKKSSGWIWVVDRVSS